MKNRLMHTVTVLFSLIYVSVTAQHHHQHQPSPYQGETSRNIKALSEQDIDNYLNGRGMGFAKAAELNSYPGPMHVLEYTRQLGLTESQKQQIQQIYDSMHQRAVALGKQIVEQEKTVDQLFARRHASTDNLPRALTSLGNLQGELRAVHLLAHVETARLLSQEQINQYNTLRGYSK